MALLTSDTHGKRAFRVDENSNSCYDWSSGCPLVAFTVYFKNHGAYTSLVLYLARLLHWMDRSDRAVARGTLL
jgi:hypothetical protein